MNKLSYWSNPNVNKSLWKVTISCIIKIYILADVTISCIIKIFLHTLVYSGLCRLLHCDNFQSYGQASGLSCAEHLSHSVQVDIHMVHWASAILLSLCNSLHSCRHTHTVCCTPPYGHITACIHLCVCRTCAWMCIMWRCVCLMVTGAALWARSISGYNMLYLVRNSIKLKYLTF